MMAHGDMTWSSGLIPMIEPTIVTQIISSMSDLALVISREGKLLGVMSSPNFRTDSDLSHWEGRPLQDVLTVESVPKFEERLDAFLRDDGIVLPVELNHLSPNGPDTDGGFPMRYSFHQIGSDGAFLMLGRDLRPVWEIQQQLVSAQIALEKDYEAQRESDSMFRVLMASSSDTIFFVSTATGEITDCGAHAAKTFRKTRRDILNTSFAGLLGLDDRAQIVERLVTAATDQATAPYTVMSPLLNATVQITPTLFRGSGEQMLLCRLVITDGEAPQADVVADGLSSLFEDGVDAILFAGRDGRILSANDAFLRLADAISMQSVKTRNVSDFLARGMVDQNVIFENATRTGAMRLYATRLISDLGPERQVEISTTLLKAGSDVAFALVIRDVSRASANRPQQADAGEVDMASVVELIGSQSLREIVAKTTDVVEKLCIETAVEMTSNNRVAAAEMLGLSRQSLYVKLRKYGLLKKDDT